MDDNSSNDIEILDSIKKKYEEDGENHTLSNFNTSILNNAFDLSDDEKINTKSALFENK